MAITDRALDTSRQQAAANSIAANAEFGSNIGVRPTRVILSHDIGYIKSFIWLKGGRVRCSTFRIVQAAVLGLSHQFQVLYRVVQRIAIKVMDNLPSLKWTAQMFRHNDSMLISEPPMIPYHSIARMLVDMSTYIPHRYIIPNKPATLQGGFRWLDC